MTTWNDLTSAALVGTDRRPYRGDLLQDAAVEVARRRAGRRPDMAPGGAPAPAPVEDRPAVGRRAAERLMRILGGQHDRLLPEWLAAAAATGRRVPPYTLPDLLDRGRRDRSIREHLGVLAGRRGRWLAAYNPAWSYLLDEPTGETWELGGAADRRAHLRALRSADPGAARRLLEGTWERETPDDRAEFVALLADGLSPDDEPFLEQALDDRRREVRQAAANLLTRLPGSRLARRMAERLAACVTITGDVIAVEAPEACDRAMERDGIRPKPPRGTGERAWWLQQVIARAPMSEWELPPDRLLTMRIPDWDVDVRAAWVRGAVLQRDPEWARAMFAFDPISDLLQALPPGEQQELAARFVQGRDLDSQLIMVLGGVSSPWGEELATAVLHKIVRVAATQPWNLGELVRLAGEHIDPALGLLAMSYSPVEPIQQVAALLRFRADMHKELAA
ncbi:hypothetical protein SAMN05421874_1135 [Nonomuraea maritima]|uniref:Uncharacterized protein n=1 Tax=Nonomuraea maritima TaxID=683260 RepID=A0A1G9FT69_9ACTN|nr:DUF5691 domain-containing protein [Nonomuraea maritima]SDK91598.1 hypothetical protein SAMN05421874_1135 [Nonomuraea maritima]